MVVKRRAKPLLIALISIAVLIVVLLVSAIVTWNVMMSPVDKNNDEQIEVVIKNGATSKEIATILKDKDYKKVLIVAHSGVSKAFYNYFNGLPEDGAFLKLGLKNGDVKEYKL